MFEVTCFKVKGEEGIMVCSDYGWRKWKVRMIQYGDVMEVYFKIM
jgi:hypothetical protein